MPTAATSAAATTAELERLLHDDVPAGDLTTDALGIGGRPGRMRFAARHAMTLALVEDAAAILRLAGATVTAAAGAGETLAPGGAILAAEGPAAALLRGWKVAQTLIEAWSGVATATAAIVSAARAARPDVAVACTRKTVPGTKPFAVAAVRAGGGTMHRLGLSETILVFPEHRGFLAGEPLGETVARLRRAVPERRLVVEVGSVEDGVEAARAGFDVIQAEKFPPAEIARLAAALAALAPPRPLLAAAGGIDAGNAGAYAEAGADVLVTSAPYQAKPRDVAVTIGPA